MRFIDSLDELQSLYGAPVPASQVKEVGRLTPHYRALIEASPFLVLATAGPEGLDCSPRGDRPGELVRIADDHTLLLPDRRGNDRIDSLRNILRDPRVALLFLIPGSGTTLRVNGAARISAEPDLLASFEVAAKAPRTALVIAVETVFFQCSRAVVRARLWDQASQAAAASLPTPGAILEALARDGFDGAAYDEAWPERARRSLW